MGHLPLRSQDDNAAAEEVGNYQEQIRRLIGFLEFSLNTLGNPETTTKEKEVIINQSFLKAFMDNEVQVEDDLDENREHINYKDIQAYLKDVDFFYKQVEFAFDIQDIQRQVNNDGMLYFRVITNRNLKGIAVEDGKEVNNNLVRYVEINLDEDEQVLKIVSMYTTKLNQRQELMDWWTRLPSVWKEALGKNISVTDSIPLNNIGFLDDTTLLVFRETPEIIPIDTFMVFGADTLEISGNDTLFTLYSDTISMNDGAAFRALAEVTSMENLNLAGNPYILDLSPLDQMTNLRYLNISNTGITDLFPVRNLTKLVTLTCSGTGITDLDPIKYNTNIRELYIDGTGVRSLQPVVNITPLQTIQLSNSKVDSLDAIRSLAELRDLRLDNTAVADLSPLADLTLLEHLSFSGTGVSDLSPIRYLTGLKRIYFENTPVASFDALSGLENLQTIDADRTQVFSLEPLGKLPFLEKVYCDQTLITGEIANEFMEEHNNILVIYETEKLSSWWSTVNGAWKPVFEGLVKLDNPPTREQLHQLTLIRQLDISGNVNITTLDPLAKMSNLRNLDCSGTSIEELNALHEIVDLQILNISNTSVPDLLPLADLVHLQQLDAAETDITTLAGLEGLTNLQKLTIDGTGVEDLTPLKENINLQFIYCDRTNIGKFDIDQYLEINPGCLVIYQTSVLRSWWQGLPETWKNVFSSASPVDPEPTKEQLQVVANIKEINIDGNTSLQYLNPLVNLGKLEKLSLSATQVSNLEPLARLARLKDLDLSNNPISDLSAIRGLNLTSLDISNTAVADLEAVASFTSLEYLNCSGTQIRKLDPLAVLFSLRKIDCYSTGVKNLKALEGLPALRQVNCYNTGLSQKKVDAFKNSRPDIEVNYY